MEDVQQSVVQQWDTKEQEENEADPKFDRPAFEGDKWFYRTIALCLGLVVILCVGGVVYLSHADKEVPQTLTALGSTAIGAFAGVLVDTKRR